MRFEYWQSSDGSWQWDLKSSLGDTVAHGTPSCSRELCLTSIRLVTLAATAECHLTEPVAAPVASPKLILLEPQARLV